MTRIDVPEKGLGRVGARPSLPAYIKQIWCYRDFIWFDARSRASAGNYDDSLGLIWVIINPILNGLTYFFVFGVLLGTGKGVPNFIAYLLIGVFVFRFTTTIVSQGSRSLRQGRSLIQAFDFPRATLPIATGLRELLLTIPTYIVMMLLILVMPPAEPITAWWFVIIPVTILQFFFSTGIAMILARLVARRNDFTHLISVGLRIWMYLSAVFFSISRFENHPEVYFIMSINPAFGFLDIVRNGLLYGQGAPMTSWISVLVSTFVFSIVGLLVFWQAEEKYGDER